jgi:hypothetical protein
VPARILSANASFYLRAVLICTKMFIFVHMAKRDKARFWLFSLCFIQILPLTCAMKLLFPHRVSASGLCSIDLLTSAFTSYLLPSGVPEARESLRRKIEFPLLMLVHASQKYFSHLLPNRCESFIAISVCVILLLAFLH